MHADFSRDGGADATRQLLDGCPGLTAILALNDSMAVGALSVLRANRIRVPEDISLIGFDDMPIAVDVTPALTTVRLPLIEMGTRAMTLALDDEDPEGRRETIEVSLVWRESCAAIPA